MPAILSGPGKVAVLPDSDLPAFITVRGFPRARAMLNQVAMSQAVSLQIMRTLGQRVFIYGFGDNIGDLRISGVGFANRCISDYQTGFSDVFNYYLTNKVVPNNSTVMITLDNSSTLLCYLVSVAFQVVHEEFRTVGFTMNFLVPPIR